MAPIDSDTSQKSSSGEDSARLVCKVLDGECTGWFDHIPEADGSIRYLDAGKCACIYVRTGDSNIEEFREGEIVDLNSEPLPENTGRTCVVFETATSCNTYRTLPIGWPCWCNDDRSHTGEVR